MRLKIWTDGTSKPKLISKRNKDKNGPSAGAIIIKEDEKVIYSDSFFLGIIDNNQAEYQTFINAIKYILNLNVEHVCFYTDSNLIEKQMTGQYSANKQSIVPYYNEARELLKQLKSWEVIWISRKENSEADKMADECIKRWYLEKEDI